MRVNNVKRSLQAGQVQVGTWIHTFGSYQLPQVLATAGFDYVHIDMEHSAFSLQTVAEMCQASQSAGLVPFVRPAGREHHLVSRPLDNGAMGILMAHVDDSRDAEAAVRAVKFPPIGDRGSQPPSFHTSFARVNPKEYMAQANDETLLLVQIESLTAIGNLDEILGTPGVDGATLGRGDLAAELGVPNRDHPDVLAAVHAMIAACRRNQKIPGLLVQEVDEARDWIAQGVRLVTYASEVLMLRNAAAAAVQTIKAAAREAAPGS